MRIGSATLLCLLALLLCGTDGCGYSQSNHYEDKPQGNYPWHSLYRQDIRTVAVPIFTNRTFSRGVEFSLTKAFISDLESTTPYKVIDRAKADTIFEAEIVSCQGAAISTDRNTALPQEELVTIGVNFIWKDLRSGKILVQRKDFQQATTYYPTLGEGSFVGKQTNVERLALAMVHELQAEW